jgi:hypothetical protein
MSIRQARAMTLPTHCGTPREARLRGLAALHRRGHPEASDRSEGANRAEDGTRTRYARPPHASRPPGRPGSVAPRGVMSGTIDREYEPEVLAALRERDIPAARGREHHRYGSVSRPSSRVLVPFDAECCGWCPMRPSRGDGDSRRCDLVRVNRYAPPTDSSVRR